MHLRLAHPRAKHIICAYSIPGIPRYDCEDYCDDGEHGAGHYMPKTLQVSNVTNLAVFIVQYQHGQKIGSVRFQLMWNALQSAVQMHPLNPYTNHHMVLIQQVQDQHKVRSNIPKGGGPKYSEKNKGQQRSPRGKGNPPLRWIPETS